MPRTLTPDPGESMQKSWQQTFVLGACMGFAFLLGQLCKGPTTLEAQGGRGPVNNPPPAGPTTPPTGSGAGPGPAPVVYSEDGGHGAGSNGFLAVTGSYGVGTSVLYVIDTNSRQLAVYEARGGANEQRRVILVGARRIDLDLQLEDYNDRSEYDYRELKKLFHKRGEKDTDVGTGLVPSSGHK